MHCLISFSKSKSVKARNCFDHGIKYFDNTSHSFVSDITVAIYCYDIAGKQVKNWYHAQSYLQIVKTKVVEFYIHNYVSILLRFKYKDFEATAKTFKFNIVNLLIVDKIFNGRIKTHEYHLKLRKFSYSLEEFHVINFTQLVGPFLHQLMGLC